MWIKTKTGWKSDITIGHQVVTPRFVIDAYRGPEMALAASEIREDGEVVRERVKGDACHCLSDNLTGERRLGSIADLKKAAESLVR